MVVSSELPPGPGGIGTHAHALATELHRQGRQVSLLGSQHYVDGAERTRFNASSEVPISTFTDAKDPVRTAVARAGQIRRAAATLRPDVVVASGARVLWMCAAARWHRQVPVVAVVHGTEVSGPRWQRELSRLALDRMSEIVAVSNFTAGLVDALGVDGPPLDVIHNGADADRFGPDAMRGQAFRERHALGTAPVILTVGNVTERKGQHVVVDALPEVLASVPDAHYVMIGRPTEAASLEARARRLGVADAVSVLGQLDADEVQDGYRAADAFAMTSTSPAAGDVEGYGIAVTEAALSAVPAVVTRGTGAEEAVADGETGLVADPTPPSVATALTRLLADDELRTRLGSTARHVAITSGTWAARAEGYGEVLDRVVSGHRPRILVVSHTAHHRTDEGTTVGFGPTLRELDRLATLGSELTHVAPLYPGPPPGNALPIEASNIRHVPVRPAGGDSNADRLRAFGVVPSWVRVIAREMRRSDVVHVRTPAGISMAAVVLLSLRRKPTDRWIKYAGNWSPDGRDPLTYRVQRAWLRSGLARAAVTVNGSWTDQPPWIHAFDNPTLTPSELEAGRDVALRRAPGPPFRAVFVGRLEREKGAHVAVDVVDDVRRRGLDISLDLVGDGPLRGWVEQRLTEDEHLAGRITLHGWLPRRAVEERLAAAHVMLLPTSAAEGFPKVVGEALAFGCVPITSGISSMGQVLTETGGAVVVDPSESWADAVARVLSSDDLRRLVDEGLGSAPRFGYERYLDRVRGLAAQEWGRIL